MNPTQNLSVSAADTDTPAEVVTPASTLRGAATYLETYGWNQRVYYGGDLVDAFPPACADGAIGIAAYGYPALVPGDNTSDPGFRDYKRAVDYLIDYLDLNGIAPKVNRIVGYCEPVDHGSDPYAWNDHEGQTAEAVIATLRAAADDYDRTHAHRPADHAAETEDNFLIDEPLTDVGGYLLCGCHGTQRDHTCKPF
jgi:hypothetical protein